MKFFSYRLINLYATLLILLVLFAAGYIQLSQNIPPCPLCVMQRIIFAWLGLLFIAGMIYVPRTIYRKIYNGIILLFSVMGIVVSMRHIYLQHLPEDQVPACGAGFNFIVKHLPPFDALKMLLMGSGECAKINWKFMDLSIPEWALIFFIILSVVALIQMSRQRT